MDSYTIMGRCYTLFRKHNWEELENVYLSNVMSICIPHTVFNDTAIHVAVYSNNKELVHTLLKVVYEYYKGLFFGDLPIIRKENDFGNTPLHEAASTENLEMVKIIVQYDPEQLTAKNKEDETPLFMAAVYGRTNVIKFLAKEVNNINDHMRSRTSSMLHEAIRGYYFETALELIKLKCHIDICQTDDHGKTCFQLLADTPSAFNSGYSPGRLEKLIYLCLPVDDDSKVEDEKNNVSQSRSSTNTDEERGLSEDPRRNVCQCFPNPALQMIIIAKFSKLYLHIWKTIANGFPLIKKLMEKKKTHSLAVKLSKFLAREDKSWLQDKSNGSQNEIPLFAAAKNGITEILEAILEVSPQAIEHENHKKENIFHVAVENSRLNVMKYLLRSCHISYPRLMWKIDDVGDSILHKAAYNKGLTVRERPGEALCLQSEIQWFEQVKELVPAHITNQENKLKLTPQALFTKEHKDLVKNGQKWLVRTANSCIIVAVLIATVAFTSIYTVPGGSRKKLANEPKKSGSPVFLNTTEFTVYTASDVASLCFAFTSVVVFLSISTSKMNEQDFRRSLPFKLVLGLSMLFWSVVALMSGFAAALQITISNKLHQTTAPIITIACFPAAFFLLLQLPLYVNITWFIMIDLLRFIGFIPSTFKKYSSKNTCSRSLRH